MEWIGEHRGEEVFIKAGKLIEQNVDKVLANSGQRTADLGGSIGCEAFGRLVVDEIKHA
jgi:3-isopropylmalate dehydrogenase